MNTLLNEASSQDQLLKTLETIGFSEISADDFIKKFPEFKDKIRKPIEKVWGLKMRAGAYADTWVMKVDDKYDPYITYIDGNKRMHSGAMFVSSFLNKISGNAKEQLELGEKSDNLSYIGNCTDDEVVDHIFGDASGFANAVEEYGDDFVLDDLVVKYDPKKDIHSFYYKEQFVTEKLSKKQPAAVWIKDFIDSTNPKFKGKTKKERISMALGAYYAAQKNEAYDESSPFKTNDDSIEYDPEQLAAGIKVEMEHTDDKEIATIIAKHHLAEDPKYYIKLASCVEEYGAGFEGTDELRKKYIKDTPGQSIQQFKTEMKQKTYAIVDVTNDTVVATASTEVEAKQIVSDTMRRFDNEIDLEIVKSSERPELEEASTRLTEAKYKVTLQKWADTQRGDVTLDKKEVEITASSDDDAKSKAEKLVPKETGKDWSWRVYDVTLDKKEEALQEAVPAIDVEELLDAAAKMRKEFPQLRKGQSIMLTLYDMNPIMYSMAAAKHDAFTVDAKIPDLINFLDPKYYAESSDLEEAINIRDYMATSEKSPQFGGYRPHVVDKAGKTMYLSQWSYKTAESAKDHAEEYLKQYARGISEPRVKIDKDALYVREASLNEKESYDSWIIKPREGNGEQVKIKARDEISAIEIALGRKPSQNEIDFFNFHYILIHEKTNVSTLRHMKIVELATKCTDLELVKEFVEQQYKPQTSALQIKESFNSFVSNK